MFSKLALFSLITLVIGYANAQTFIGDEPSTILAYVVFLTHANLPLKDYTQLGSCGQQNTDSDLIAALNAPQYDASNPCGRGIRVTYQGKAVDVTIVDRCAGCTFGDVDLSPIAFNVISDPSAGRIPVTWQFI